MKNGISILVTSCLIGFGFSIGSTLGTIYSNKIITKANEEKETIKEK